VTLIKQPVHDKGVKDENDARNGLPQMHDGMFVVMATAALRPVLVMS
jgi:hypothetical protein